MVNKADLSSIGNIISKAISDNDLFLHSYREVQAAAKGKISTSVAAPSPPVTAQAFGCSRFQRSTKRKYTAGPKANSMTEIPQVSPMNVINPAQQ